MENAAAQAYEVRVSKMGRNQIEATLKNHDGIVGTPRWSALSEKLRSDLEAMAAVLRKALQ